MNPLLHAQLSRLRGNVQQLQERLQDTTAKLERESERADEQLKKNWRLEKETATLRHNQADYERLQQRVESLEELQEAIGAHAESLRSQTQRLVQSLMP